MIGEAQDEIRTAVSGAGARATDGVAGEPAIKLHEAKLSVVTRIEGLDVLVIELATDFKGVPAACPGDRVFGLPDVIVKARRLLRGSEVRQCRIAKVDCQEPVNPC